MYVEWAHAGYGLTARNTDARADQFSPGGGHRPAPQRAARVAGSQRLPAEARACTVQCPAWMRFKRVWEK